MKTIEELTENELNSAFALEVAGWERIFGTWFTELNETADAGPGFYNKIDALLPYMAKFGVNLWYSVNPTFGWGCCQVDSKASPYQYDKNPATAVKRLILTLVRAKNNSNQQVY